MLILKKTQGTLDVEFDTAADANVTVTITDADGNAIETAADATHDSGGRYTFALPPQPNVADLTCEWTGVFDGVAETLETDASIVGRRLFTIPELRAFKGGALSNADAYPDELLAGAHDEIADFFQRVCDVSFIPRYGQTVMNGNWRRAIWVNHRKLRKLLRVAVDGTVLDDSVVSQMAIYASGKVDRTALWGSYWQGWRDDNVAISYEHGWASPPARIRSAALLLARYELVKTDPTDRMVAVSNDLGTVRLSIPSFVYPTGLPPVDAVLARYDEHSPIEPF